MVDWHYRELCSCPKLPVGLRAVAPDALPGKSLRHFRSHEIDHTRAVAMRDDPREGHTQAEEVCPLLRIARVDARCGHTDAYLGRPGDGIRQFTHLKHISCQPRPIVQAAFITKISSDHQVIGIRSEDVGSTQVSRFTPLSMYIECLSVVGEQ